MHTLSQTTSKQTGSPAPQPLPDLRPIPPAFGARRTRALFYNEGGTWAWHWGVINNILAFSMCAKGGGGGLEFLVPDGWETVGAGTGQLPGVYDLIQTDGSPPMPFMALLKTKARRNASMSSGGSDASGSGSGSGSSSKNSSSSSGDVDSPDGQLAIVFRGTNSGPEWMLGALRGFLCLVNHTDCRRRARAPTRLRDTDTTTCFTPLR